jgi:tetratricopeptide (TPR) repeat protein
MHYHGRRITLSILLAVLSTGATTWATSPDELPMYGGLDRAANPGLKRIDDQFIADVTKQFGSREKASDLFVEQGVRFYSADNYSKAMRRFNQAWLLNPNSPDPYWGFAMVYHDKQQVCEAQKMIDMALDRGLHKPIALADAGRVITLCASHKNDLSSDDKAIEYARSESMYTKAIAEAPKNDYILSSWATAYYWRGDYPQAWKKVEEARSVGATLPGRFIEMLRAKMAEPRT